MGLGTMVEALPSLVIVMIDLFDRKRSELCYAASF
jgi:hypothetical protein